jgi:YgiT-type zinc finger domain-containing protein
MSVTTLKCEECGIGKYRSFKTPYLLRLGKHMMVLPDAPAYACDVCGFRCFDDVFLESIHAFLLDATESDERPTKHPRPLQPEQPIWFAARRPR